MAKLVSINAGSRPHGTLAGEYYFSWEDGPISEYY